jgi:hypothetical protein
MSGDRHRESEISVPRDLKGARGTETDTGKMARRVERADKGARDRTRTTWGGEGPSFFANEPGYAPGKGLGEPQPTFAKSTPAFSDDKRLAPGNCARWDMAMTQAAILNCTGLRVWQDWHPG